MEISKKMLDNALKHSKEQCPVHAIVEEYENNEEKIISLRKGTRCEITSVIAGILAAVETLSKLYTNSSIWEHGKRIKKIRPDVPDSFMRIPLYGENIANLAKELNRITDYDTTKKLMKPYILREYKLNNYGLVKICIFVDGTMYEEHLQQKNYNRIRSGVFGSYTERDLHYRIIPIDEE